MIISSSTLDSIRTEFSRRFEDGYQQTEVWWNKIATEIPSSTKVNTYGWIAKQLKLREWIGPRVAANLEEHHFQVTNKSFEGTIEVDRDEVEDDNLGLYTNLFIPQLAAATKKHPDQLLKTLIQSNPTSFDGKALFAGDHPVFDDAGSTYDNDHAATALTASNFEVVWETFIQTKGEDGEVMGIMPTHLIVPPQLKKEALDIVAATLVGGGNTNVLVNWVDVLVIPELANEGTKWYLAALNMPIKPFIWQVRRAPQFISRDNPNDPKVFDQKKFTYGVDYRGEVAPTLPFLIHRATA